MVSPSSRCLEGLHLVEERTGMLIGYNFVRGVLVQRTTKPSCVYVKAAVFCFVFLIFLLQASVNGVGELRVKFTFTAMLRRKVILSILLVSKQSIKKKF